MQFLETENNFLGLENTNHYSYKKSKVVIQPIPYEYSSSYHKGSSLGPQAMIDASQFVEFYDEELDKETCFEQGICTLKALDFSTAVNEDAINLIYEQTKGLLVNNKFVVSLGAEHTVTFGLVKAMHEQFDNLSVLQIDAHSDLRQSYEGSIWSHASVMARVNELNIPITQVGIRAQCKEEAELIKKSSNIHTWYAHEIRDTNHWIEECSEKLTDNVYITIDADGFDPSIMPAVGTAEPNGLLWDESLRLFKHIFATKNVVGFDIVECAPRSIDTLTEYNLAKLAYKLIGLKFFKK
jgi:agmatinase